MGRVYATTGVKYNLGGTSVPDQIASEFWITRTPTSNWAKLELVGTADPFGAGNITTLAFNGTIFDIENLGGNISVTTDAGNISLSATAGTLNINTIGVKFIGTVGSTIATLSTNGNLLIAGTIGTGHVF